MKYEHGVDGRAGLAAGLIAGLAYYLLVAALAVQADLASGVLGIAAHFLLSMAYGVLLAVLIGRAGWIEGLPTGFAFGLALWIANYFVIAPAFFPWLAPMRAHPVLPALHVFFGCAAAAAYLGLRRSVDRRRSLERRHWNAAVARERRAPHDRRGVLAA